MKEYHTGELNQAVPSLLSFVLTGGPGANILLAHFHYCNKGVYPFSDECKDTELQNLGHLNDAQSHFITNSRALIKRSGKFVAINAMVEF